MLSPEPPLWAYLAAGYPMATRPDRRLRRRGVYTREAVRMRGPDCGPSRAPVDAETAWVCDKSLSPSWVGHVRARGCLGLAPRVEGWCWAFGGIPWSLHRRLPLVFGISRMLFNLPEPFYIHWVGCPDRYFVSRPQGRRGRRVVYGRAADRFRFPCRGPPRAPVCTETAWFGVWSFRTSWVGRVRARGCLGTAPGVALPSGSLGHLSSGHLGCPRPLRRHTLRSGTPPYLVGHRRPSPRGIWV